MKVHGSNPNWSVNTTKRANCQNGQPDQLIEELKMFNH